MIRLKFKQLFFLLSCYLLASCQSGPKSASSDIKVKKIWDSAEHSAFTDLLKFNKSYYCSFREGSGHVPGTNGLIRILKSSDGENWESHALIAKEGIDLRDPKLSITPDGKIMVIMGGSFYSNGELLGCEPQVSFSDKSGTQFSAPEKVTIDPEIVSWGNWIWGVTWYKGTGYAIDYQIKSQESRGSTTIYLVKTTDGNNFEKVTKLDLDGAPNEATIRFDEKGTMFVVIRREQENKMGVWAKSEAPYNKWDFKDMNFRLGGPNFVFLDNEKVILGSRAFGSEVNTSLFGSGVYTALFLGTKEGDFEEIVHLPSGGDTSYPGLVLDKDRLLVSYYSSHEGKTSIYIAEIPLQIISKAKK